jgi:hypothetical protein
MRWLYSSHAPPVVVIVIAIVIVIVIVFVIVVVFVIVIVFVIVFVVVFIVGGVDYDQVASKGRASAWRRQVPEARATSMHDVV